MKITYSNKWEVENNLDGYFQSKVDLNHLFLVGEIKETKIVNDGQGRLRQFRGSVVILTIFILIIIIQYHKLVET